MSGQLDTLLALYKPNVGKGNYQADIANRGRNDMLVRVIVALGLASEEDVRQRFREFDQRAYAESEARLARINRRARQEAKR